MNTAVTTPTKQVAFSLLRNNATFRKYWLARLISMIGDRFYFLALPWLVLELTGGSVISTAITLGLETAPLLITLPFMGVLIDRYDRKMFMLIADYGRAFVMAIIFILSMTDMLSVYHIYFAAVIMSIFTQLFDTSSQSYLPHIVEKPDLLEANANIATVSSFLSTAGHLVSGIVIVLLTATGSIFFNCLSFLLSAVFLNTLPAGTVAASGVAMQQKLTQIKEGFSYLFGHKTLFPLALFSGIMNIAIVPVTVMLFFSAKEVFHLSPAQTSLIFMIGGIFSFTGSLLVKRVAKKINKGRLIRFGSLGVLLALWILWQYYSFAALIIGQSILVFVSVFVGVSMMTYRQEVVPNELLGRVTSSFQLFTASTIPIALIGGGWLASVTSAQTVFMIGFIIVSFNVLLAWFGNLRHIQ